MTLPFIPGEEIALEHALEEAGPVVAAAPAVEAGATAPRGLGLSTWFSIGWLALVVLGAIFANLLPLADPNASLAAPPNLGPGIHHLLGTDPNGRDVLARLIFGSRVSLVVGFGTVAIGLLVGGAAGLVAGYYGKSVDYLFNFVAFVFLAFPQIILAIGLVTFMGHQLWVITVALGIVAIPIIFRIVRATTQSYARREFVQASRALGARTHRILLKEILPNVAMTALAFVFIAVGIAILGEAGLSFVGSSVGPPQATWGNMILVATNALNTNKVMWIWPSLALLLTVLSLNIIGDKLRSHFGLRDSFL